MRFFYRLFFSSYVINCIIEMIIHFIQSNNKEYLYNIFDIVIVFNAPGNILTKISITFNLSIKNLTLFTICFNHHCNGINVLKVLTHFTIRRPQALNFALYLFGCKDLFLTILFYWFSWFWISLSVIVDTIHLNNISRTDTALRRATSWIKTS
jgi:hypothetical protein